MGNALTTKEIGPMLPKTLEWCTKLKEEEKKPNAAKDIRMVYKGQGRRKKSIIFSKSK